MENLNEITFYIIEKSIKEYRKYAQHKINESGIDITIDQWLVLKTIHENGNLSQNKIAEIVFKDIASLTRMIELLVKKDFIIRYFSKKDRRRVELSLTKKGIETLKELQPIIHQNRNQALKGLSPTEIEILKTNLSLIISNCK